MPLKIKLPRSNHLDPSGANSSRNQASSFPLPPNNELFASDAPVRAELTVAANNFDSNDGNTQQISHVSVGILQPNQQQTMLQPPPPPTDFDLSSNNNNYQAAATTTVERNYNEPPTQHNWQHERIQQETTQIVMNPMEITNQVGYKDFLPPPNAHELKNSTEKGSSCNNNIMSNDSSNLVPQMNEHDLATSIDGKSINYNNFYQDRPQQQHLLIPPLPLQHEGMENTSYENENENDIIAPPPDGTTEMVYQEQGQNNNIISIYAYSTLHQQKSWNEMIDLFTRFTEVNGHSDVEMDNVKLLMSDKNNSNNDSGDNDSEEEETLLMIRSWVRELRYIRNAYGSNEGVEKNNSTKLSTRQQQQQRCDSETLTSDRISQLNQLSFPWKIYDDNDDDNNSQWQKWIDDFLHYRSKNGGDCNVPLKLQENPSLGNFVNRQRAEYRKMMNGKQTTMTNTKVQELERVGFIFSVREGGHTSWDERLAELVAYQHEHGDTLVPKKYPPNPSLGYWVNEQRGQYQRAMNAKSSTMNKKRQEKLNAINFKWSIREPPREFAEWIKLLKLYKSQWGDCNVPLKYKQDLSLGSFCNNARTQYKKFQSGLSSNMTQEKIHQLEEIGFVWNIRQGRTPWAARFEELMQYKERYGHCNVSKEWMENQKLAAWVTKQKSQYKLYTAGKECNLTEEKVDKLSELGLFSDK